jgi:hypothetical protein
MHTGFGRLICWIVTELSRIMSYIERKSKKQIESGRIKKQHVYRQQTSDRDSGMSMHGLVRDRQRNLAKSRSAWWWWLPCMKRTAKTKNRSRFISLHARLGLSRGVKLNRRRGLMLSPQLTATCKVDLTLELLLLSHLAHFLLFARAV